MSDKSRLHQALVDNLKRTGLIRTPRVEAAFRTVDRHLFLKNLSVFEVYQDKAIVTKRLDGQPVSSSSQPAMMAIMLEQLDLEPGHRVLEIGAGTGYNAALIAHIVGHTGKVITIDIDNDIAENARAHLITAGFDQVQVVCTDGGFGYPDAAPYDRIILTVSAWDIVPAWVEQLKPNGILLLPLTIKEDVQLAVAFMKADGYLVSISISNCGFMMLRGVEGSPQEFDRIQKNIVFRIKKFLALLFWFLPLSLQLKLYNKISFGHSSLEGLEIKAYPKETDYIPKVNEFLIIKPYTRLVLSWL
jgi:protein-L-isoaspartate(D-aspartate) O-methyltransferase